MPVTETPAPAPAHASPPSGGGAHHAPAKGASFATLIDARVVKANGADAAASASGDNTSNASVGDNASTVAPGAIVLNAKAALRQRGALGSSTHDIRVGTATVLPAWMRSTKPTATVADKGTVDPTDTNDDDGGDDGLDAVAQLVAPTPGNDQPAMPLTIDLTALATQIPVPGDEEATPDSDSTMPHAGGSASNGDHATATQSSASFGRSRQVPIGFGGAAGKSLAGEMAAGHAAGQVLSDASSNAVFNQQTSAEQSAVTPDAGTGEATLVDRLSQPTKDHAINAIASNAGKRAGGEIDRLRSAAARSAQQVGASTAATAAHDGAAGSSPRVVQPDAAAAPTGPTRKPLAVTDAAARPNDAANIPSIRFAQAANGDTGAQDNSQDTPREQRQAALTSAGIRLMPGSAPAAVDAAPSTQDHAVAPVFAVPAAAQASSTPVAALTEAPAAASAATIDPQNLDRLVQSMHVSAKSGVMEATVRLRPDYLGDVTIQLRVDGTDVSAVVKAESAGVRQWLESHEQTIRDGLAEHGLELSRFVIDPDGQQQSQQQQQADPDEQRRAAFRRRQQSTSAQRFEITV